MGPGQNTIQNGFRFTARSKAVSSVFALGLVTACLAYGWVQSARPVNAAPQTTPRPSTPKEVSSSTRATEESQEDVPGRDAPMSVWMEKKLKYSQESLRQLAMGDLQGLRLTAQRMHLVSKVEGFVRSTDATYADHLRTFQLANKELMRQAERGNVEGATLAFNQLTSSCVACHVTIRRSLKSGN